jgi:hypothetical protein
MASKKLHVAIAAGIAAYRRRTVAASPGASRDYYAGKLAATSALASYIAAALHEDNYRFDCARFITACSVDE